MINVEGCKGGSFSGSVLLRQHTNAALSRIRKNTAMAMVATVRPALGLPTIIEEGQMLSAHLSFSMIGPTGPFVRGEQKHPQSSIRLRVPEGEDCVLHCGPHVSRGLPRLPCVEYQRFRNPASRLIRRCKYRSALPLLCGVHAGGSETYPSVHLFQPHCC